MQLILVGIFKNCGNERNGLNKTRLKSFYPGLSKLLLFNSNLTTTSVKQLNGVTIMGSPIGYLMAHVIKNYAIDKALEIIFLNRGRQLMTR